MRKRHVTPRVAALLAALALAGALAVVAGCESKPAAPTFDNPFDPSGPTGGDALQVTAIQSDTTINVFWNEPAGLGITKYVVGHTTDPTLEWNEVASQDPAANGKGQFTYVDPEPAVLHFFRVQAFTGTSNSLTGYSPAAIVVGPPRMVPATGGKGRASRYLDLEITAGVGDTLELADSVSFAAPRHVPVVDPAQPQLVAWDLGPSDPGKTHDVYLRVLGPGSLVSDIAHLAFTASFAPRHQLVGGGSSVGSRSVDLVVPTTGVTAMRFALSAEALATEPWSAPADTVRGFMLAGTASIQKIWGGFSGDFGYDTTYALPVTPDDLSTATFSLDVPSDRVITGPEVTCRNSAVATEMRIGESGSFAGVPWQPYAASVSVALSPGEGRKVLYAQFRNDWFDSDVFTQYVDVVGQDVGVSILAPADGDTVIGGSRLQVRGTALAGSASGVVDSVRVDLGDTVGWRMPSGTLSWDLMWDVPAVAADTPVILRARAWATDPADSTVSMATTSVNVTVKPPAR